MNTKSWTQFIKAIFVFAIVLLMVVLSAFSPQGVSAIQGATPTLTSTSTPTLMPVILGALTVNKLADTNDGICDSDCSLREAIAAAAPSDTINFASGLTGTITLTSTLVIDKNLTIDGSGANVIAVSGNNAVRVFYVESMVNLALDAITIRDGNAGSDNGGGIYNAGTMMLNNSILSDNLTSYGGFKGGGIYNDRGTVTVSNSILSSNSPSLVGNGGGIANSYGTVTVTNSTLSSNSAGNGGGIYNDHGVLTMTNSTVSGNQANYNYGGIYNLVGTVTITHSTIYGNSTFYGNVGGIYNYVGTIYLAATVLDTGDGGANCGSVGDNNLTDNGYNLSNDGSCSFSSTGSQNNASLNTATLADNGGLTQTHLLGGAAIDLIPNGTTITNNGVSNTCNQTGEPLDTDQRGQQRPATAGGRCDSGAVEVRDMTLSCPNPTNIMTGGELDSCIWWANLTAGPQTLGISADIILSAPLSAITSEITLNGSGRLVSGGNTMRVF